ncbi:MAG: tRNA (adenosine(37)-N6)-dimethylallyltransferase MiaA, partial [Bacteroidetes bacterium]|nr:tRNA (adenosine(37)-N6)-dimethylallyltransferase MiaA [Bacteroidota bacterium]
MIVILGPTASGKTHLATHLAHRIGGEIVSADSRQVYRGMNIGTGKDLDEYVVAGMHIPYHLIDIREAGEKYNVHEFRQDASRAIREIGQREKVPILCGGTG